MLRRRRPCVAVEDQEALAFGDQAPDVPQHAGDAPSSPPPAAAETTSAPLSLAATVFIDSPPAFSLSAGVRESLAEVLEEGGWPEKRPRIEASSSSPAPPPPIEADSQPSQPNIWRPDLEGMLGRPLVVIDRAGSNPLVVAVLGRTCALPWDMEWWGKMDNGMLLLSTMRSVISVNF